MTQELIKNFVLFYQPQYNYDGECVGVESLLRFYHSKYGMIYPPLVIKLAEECGLLKKLEIAIFEKSLADYDKVKAKYGDVKLSINVTGKMVFESEFINMCRKMAEDKMFDSKHICVEVTEKAAIALNDNSLNILEELQGMGLKLAIDDFSMGHTSIQYLRHSIFDVIKLDGSLVKGLSSSNNCREIVASIIDLSRTLDMTVLAEYVETEEEKEMLHKMGCDNYQGHLFSKAEPLEQ